MFCSRAQYDEAAHKHAMHLGASLWGYDNATETIIAGHYIRVVQDIRGKYGSEGDFVMNRPIHGLLKNTHAVAGFVWHL
jgi:uncharacterized protein